MKTMFMTVGTGGDMKDAAGAIVRSIRNQNPNRVVFVLSKTAAETTLPGVREKIDASVAVCEIVLDDIEDIKKISRTIVAEMRKELRTKGNDIVADYTGGTKPMSAGLALAAVRFGLPALVYVHGDRDAAGMVVPGTEKVTSFMLDEFYSRMAFRESISFFNNRVFFSSMKVLEGMSYGSEWFVEDTSQMRHLAEGFYRWDIFDLKGAMACFRMLDEKFLRKCGIKARMEKCKEVLNREIEDEFGIERAVDLFCNARRRASEAKYDDAVARLYRLTEFLIQIEAHSLGILAPGSFEVDSGKIPPDLAAKYGGEEGRLPKKLPLSLLLLLDLLLELPALPQQRRAILSQTREEHKKFLGLRNRSILAHGFNYLSEKEYAEFEGIVLNYAGKLHDRFGSILEKFSIPEINYQEE